MVRSLRVLSVSTLSLFAFSAVTASAQVGGAPDMAPVNDRPNPYQTISDWAKLPAGRTWGSTNAVAIDRDGVSVWVAERCGGNIGTCVQRPDVDPVMKFDASGNLVTSFGKGMIAWPHAIYVDASGNVWVVDGQSNAGGRGGGAPAGAAGGRGGAAPAGATAGGAAGAAGAGRGRGAAAPPAAADRGRGAPAPAADPGRGAAPPAPAAGRGAAAPAPGRVYGNQVLKFSPTGQLLMSLGDVGGNNQDGFFFQPNSVLVARNGDIFVSEGHNANARARILVFDASGKLLRTFGTTGDGPGQFHVPHDLALDSQGRLFVADRGNNRIQIFSQTGELLDVWYQFSRPSGLWIDPNDVLYAADSESGSTSLAPTRTAWKRGIRVGSARTGEVTYLVPDPNADCSGSCAAEEIAVDRNGVLLGAEVGPPGRLQRYVRRAEQPR